MIAHLFLRDKAKKLRILIAVILRGAKNDIIYLFGREIEQP